MSGGQRRRVSLAQALLGSPPVLILDEPTTGVDPEQRVVLRAVLAELARTSVVVLSTHQTEDVAALCERVIVLDRGRVRYDGPVTALTGQAAGRVWLADAAGPGRDGVLADRHRPVPQRRRPRPGRGRARRAVPRRRLPAAARRDHRTRVRRGGGVMTATLTFGPPATSPGRGHLHRARRPGDAPVRPQPGLPVRRRAHRVRALERAADAGITEIDDRQPVSGDLPRRVRHDGHVLADPVDARQRTGRRRHPGHPARPAPPPCARSRSCRSPAAASPC